MNETERKNLVESRISTLINEFNRYPDKFLTEEDVRAYLYHLLLDGFSEIEETEDDSHSISLHCEIRWYGQGQNLRYLSDIVIFDVSQLKTQDDNQRLPSKGYGFNNPNVIIEIKLRRKGNKSDNQYKTDLEGDRRRLAEIKSQVSEAGHNIYPYLVAFDKKSNINFEVHNTEYNKEYYIYKGQNATNRTN